MAALKPPVRAAVNRSPVGPLCGDCKQDLEERDAARSPLVGAELQRLHFRVADVEARVRRVKSLAFIAYVLALICTIMLDPVGKFIRALGV